MKLIVEKQGEIVKAIKIEYTPTEALIINQAMRRYVDDEEVNEENRKVMAEVVQHKVYAYGLSLSPSDKEQLIKAVLTGTPIPDNATNGDVMKAMFPNMEFNIVNELVWTRIDGEFTRFSTEWWNAPYQKAG